jgi:hypothetical protein
VIGVGRDAPRTPYPDRPLEESFFPDRGCEVWSRCLTCPLMTCIDDELDARKAVRRHRDRMLYRRYLEERAPTGHRPAIRALALEFNLHSRTVERIVDRLTKEER